MNAVGSITDFVNAYPTVAFLLSSGLIFHEGYRAFSFGRDNWIFWQILGECIAFVGLGYDIYNRESLGILMIAIALGAEIWLTLHCRSTKLGAR